MMRTAIFIPARYDSTRFKAKHVQSINGMESLGYLITRMKEVGIPIIVCSTALPNDIKYLKPVTERKGAIFFAGDKDNIILRQYQCAVSYDIENIINIDGDDVLACPDIVKEVLRFMPTDKVVRTYDLPLGLNVMGYPREVLEKSLNFSSDTGWGEKIFKNPRLDIIYNREFQDCRLTVDYEQDYKLIRHIAENCKDNLTLDGIMGYLTENPELLEINRSMVNAYWANYERNKGV